MKPCPWNCMCHGQASSCAVDWRWSSHQHEWNSLLSSSSSSSSSLSSLDTCVYRYRGICISTYIYIYIHTFISHIYIYIIYIYIYDIVLNYAQYIELCILQLHSSKTDHISSHQKTWPAPFNGHIWALFGGSPPCPGSVFWPSRNLASTWSRAGPCHAAWSSWSVLKIKVSVSI